MDQNMNDQEREMYEQNVITQEMINSYMKKNEKPTVGEQLQTAGSREILGILTDQHRIALQGMVRDYAQELGFDINAQIKEKGGTRQILGILSDVEKVYADELINNYMDNQQTKDSNEMVI